MSDKAPSSGEAFAKRPVSDSSGPFYEWRKTETPKLPFAIAMKDGRPFTFAGLWEGWKDPESGEWLRTCTIITSEPNELGTQIHPRTPVILPTPVIVNDVRSTLHRVFLLFDSVSGSIRSVHVYNGSAKVQEFNG